MAVFPFHDLELAILKNQHFAKSPSGAIYHYEEGVYKPTGDDYIAKQIKVILRQRKLLHTWTIAGRERVIESIKDELPLLTIPDTHTINFKNGLYDLDRHKLGPHTPNHLSPIQIPITFNSEAVCPAWDDFLGGGASTKGVFPDDAGTLAYELIGYLLCPDVSRQKAFFLIGPSGTGKSTFLRAVEDLVLGKENVSHESLSKINGDKFATYSLEGKLANICGEIPGGRSREVSTFNSVVAGEGISAQKKFGQLYTLVPRARLLFSSNEIPSSEGGNPGWKRRVLAIQFNTAFSGTLNQDNIIRKLGIPAELSGMLNKALAGYAQVRKSGTFTMSESIKAFNQEFHIVSDDFERWLNTVTTPKGTLSKPALLEAYNREHPKNPLTEELFARQLLQRRPDLGSTRPGTGSDRIRHWVGLSFKIEV